MDGVDFDYELTGKGWSRARLRIGSREIVATASYLGDALGDLLRALVQVNDGAVDARALWDEEPGQYRWMFTRVGVDDVRVRLLCFADLWSDEPDDEGEVRFDETCPLRLLTEAVKATAHRVLDEHGVDGYRAKWVEHDFPLAELAELEKLSQPGP